MATPGEVVFAQTAITVIAAVAAKKLLTPEDESPLKDESLPTLSTRGSYIPVLIGTRRISPFIAWTGNRNKEEEISAGGKGGNTGGNSDQIVYYEDGVHVLAISPGDHARVGLHRIKINGKNAKFNDKKPLYSDEQVSGSSWETKDGDTFQIFWGTSSPLQQGDLAASLGVDTKWTAFVIVFWKQKRLGGFPTWPNIQYDLEIQPKTTAVNTTGWEAESWMQNGPGPNGTPHDILGVRNSSKVGDDTDFPYIKVWNKGDSATTFYKPNSFAEVYDQPDVLVNKLYAVDSSVYDEFETYLIIDENFWYGAGQSNFEEDIENWTPDSGNVALNPNFGLPDSAWPTGFTSSSGDLVTIRNFDPTTLQGASSGSTVNIAKGAVHFRFYMFGLSDLVDHCSWVQFGIAKKGSGQSEGPIMSIVRDLNNDYTIATTGDDDWFGNKYYLYDVTFEDAGNNWHFVSFKHRINEADFPFGTEEFQVFIKCYSGSDPNEAKIRIFNWEEEDNDTIWMYRGNNGKGRKGITTVEFAEPLVGLVPEEGKLEGYSDESNKGADGPNPAYTLAQLLFEPWPWGRGLDQGLWDLDSLSALATSTEAEGLRLHVLATEGKSVEEAVKAVLVDCHAYITWDPNKGKYCFGTLREPVDVPTLPVEAMAKDYAEQESILDPDIPSSVTYSFVDRDLGYRKNTQPVYDDSNNHLQGGRKTDNVSLETPTDIFAARTIAAWRRDEITIPVNKYKITAKGEARTLVPGNTIKVENFPTTGEEEILRIGSIKIEPDSPEIVIDAVTDIRALTGEETLGPLSGPDDGGFGPGAPETGTDLYTALWELPPFLSGEEISVSMLRIAANDLSVVADILASTDGAEYAYVGINKAAIGGLLVDEIPQDTLFTYMDGPVITPVGARPLTDVPSLSDQQWQRGKTVVYIDGELFYLRKVTPTGAGGYRLDGLLRARLGTSKSSHFSGTTVYIFSESDIKRHSDAAFSAGNFVYLKSQPTGLSLAEAARAEREIAGVGIRPLPVQGLRTGNLSNHYRTGENITVSWVFYDPVAFSGRYGSGFQRAGELKEETTEPQGYFRVTYWDGALRLRQVETRKNTLVYSNADLVADTGGPEPSTVTVDVEMIQNGYKSTTTTITVTKL